MWREIFRFEIKYHLKQPLFYFAAFVLFLFALLLISTKAGMTFSDVPATVNRNAPYVIVHGLTVLSLLGLFVITAFVATAALRDFERGTHMLFFTKPIRKSDYLLGRFAGSIAVSMILFFVTALGMAAGNFVPWQDAERLGPLAVSPFAFALLVQVLPNLILMGALFFAVAIWSRRLLVTYICVVLFLALQDAAETVASNLEATSLGGLLEPIGLVALETSVRYWTTVEYNTLLPDLSGGVLYNRLVWLGVGLLVLACSYKRFSYSRATHLRSAPKQAPVTPSRGAVPAPWGSLPRAARSFSTAATWRQLWRQTRLETEAVTRSTPFIVLLIMGLMLVLTSAYYVGQIRGTSVYPVTHLMLRSIHLSMQMFLVIIVIFYSGELIWRERTLGVAGVCDALPTPNWVFLAGKLLALVLVIAAVISASILSTICFQIYRGFYHLEPVLYAKGFLIATLSFVLLAIMSVVLQVVSRGKFTGYLLMIVFLIIRRASSELGLEHTLCRYGSHPPIPYSDMNGYGHFVEPYFWFNLHWGLSAAVLLGLCVMFWARGTERAIKSRLEVARARCRGPLRAFLMVAVGGLVATGSFIYYNTNILNEYLPSKRRETRQAEYERKYRQYREVPLPRVTDAYADVDIFPHERRVDISGSYRLENETAAPIAVLHLSIVPEVTINCIDPGEHSQVLADPELGYYIYELADPIAPGESIDLGFDLTAKNKGFVNNDSNTQVVYNGTFFNSSHFFPSLGYDAGMELIDRNKRRKHNLPPVPRMAKMDDLFARRNNYISTDADWINFETTVSTSSDQIAIAPGYLQREWEADGRRYFHYKMDSQILNFYSFLSGDYAVRRDRWNNVAIEIYYHEPHVYNIDRMIDAVKKSLDYYSKNFSPYQHRQIRVIEFPGYARFAQSFPNTIPFSEGVGFIARINDKRGFDYVFNTTAHEVAHQWWAHQVIGGNVQGATLMSESLAEYSALMVMEKEYGRDKMRRFLKYELDEYLKGRSEELVEEMPLMLVENQRYIHYNKGCMVMYALRDYIGEESLNRALARYIEQMAFQEPPYTNSLEFLACLRQVTPDSLVYVLEDMFETITLFSNRVENATYTRLDNGRYLVNLEVEARKLRADGQGNEVEIDICDWIDIGVFGEEEIDGKMEEKALFLEKRHITESRMSLKVVVDERPVRAGIDPYNKLIDRDSDDNVKKVSEV